MSIRDSAKEVRVIWSERRTEPLLLEGKVMRNTGKIKDLREVPSLTASHEMGPHLHGCKELKSSDKLKKIGS